MPLRAILFAALVAFILAGSLEAEDVPKLPSRKASVVLPLLKQITSKNGEAEIKKILGNPDDEKGGAGQAQCRFFLDDKTVVQVSIWELIDHSKVGIYQITVLKPGKAWEVVYPKSNPKTQTGN